MLSFVPLSSLPLSSVPAALGTGGPTPFYFSDRSFTTTPDDSLLPNRHFAPRVSNPVRIEQSLPLSPFAGSRSLLQVGQMSLVNSDGGLDSFLREYPIDGRQIEVKIGRPDFSYGQFATLFKGTARSRRSSQRSEVSFELRDITWRLEGAAQTTLYQGIGGLGGSPAIKGVPLPYCYGSCLNVTPVLVDSVALIFQVHDRAMRSVSAVYDKGLSLTYAGDVADITLASPAAGTYVTQLSGGYFRLGAVPAGMVTCDVEGDASYGNYVDKAADIAFRLMRDRAGLVDADIDPASFDNLRASQPAPIGFYVGPQQVSVATLLDGLFAGIGAWWGPNRLDVIECGRVEAPAAKPVAYFNSSNVLSYSFIDLTEAVDPPWYRAQVGHSRNWTPQTSDLASAVTAERRQFLANEWRYAIWTDPLVQTANLRAQDAKALGCLFRDEADAVTEAQRLGALWGVVRSGVRITLKTQGYFQRPGKTVNLDLPVRPLNGGRNLAIIGKSIDTMTNTSTLDLMW